MNKVAQAVFSRLGITIIVSVVIVVVAIKYLPGCLAKLQQIFQQRWGNKLKDLTSKNKHPEPISRALLDLSKEKSQLNFISPLNSIIDRTILSNDLFKQSFPNLYECGCEGMPKIRDSLERMTLNHIVYYFENRDKAIPFTIVSV